MNVLGYTALGRVIGVAIAADFETAAQMFDDGAYTLVAGDGDPMTGCYVDVSAQPHVVRDQIDMPVTLSGQTITGIPGPATIEIDGIFYQVAAGDLELSFDEPGKHWVRLKCDDPRYRTWHTEITV